MTQFPDRIGYDYWINSHLFIARFSGGCILNGEKYVIDPTDNALVKASTLKRSKRKARVSDAEGLVPSSGRSDSDPVAARPEHSEGDAQIKLEL